MNPLPAVAPNRTAPKVFDTPQDDAWRQMTQAEAQYLIAKQNRYGTQPWCAAMELAMKHQQAAILSLLKARTQEVKCG